MRIVLLLVLLLTPVHANDLATANKLAAAGDVEAAATAFGKAAAAAQKKRDLLAEQDIAAAIAAFLDRLPPAPTDKQKISAAIAAGLIVSELDWDHRGVFVSRTALAREGLYDATRTGVYTRLRNCGLHAGGRTRRKGDPLVTTAMHLYGSWVREQVPEFGSRRTRKLRTRVDVRGGAMLILEDAQAMAIKHGFIELLAHITTEFVIALHEHHTPKEAETYFRKAMAALPKTPDLELMIAWSGMLRARMGKDAKAYDAILQERMGDATRPPAGAGGVVGDGPQSALGAKWNRFKKGPRFLEIRRYPKGLKFLPKFARKLDLDLAPAPGLRVRDVGGVHVLVHGNAAAILRLDLAGKEALPGEGPQRTRWRAYHLLAKNESMSIGVKGVTFAMR